jgi:hypothetical protein
MCTNIGADDRLVFVTAGHLYRNLLKAVSVKASKRTGGLLKFDCLVLDEAHTPSTV